MKTLFVLLFTLLSFNISAQVKKAYTNLAQYNCAKKYYLDSINEYKRCVKYTEALRKVEKGLTSEEYNYIDDSLQFLITGKTTSVRGHVDNDNSFRQSVEKGESVFVNYTIDPHAITNRYIEMPPYPIIKPVYIQPQPMVKMESIVSTPIKTVENDTVGSLMMPDGNRYTQ